MENPVTHYEQSEYEKLVDEKFQRLQDEDIRLRKRISALEETTQEITQLTLSVQKLADSVEQMCREQKSIRTEMQDENTRLKELEDKDGKKWRQMWNYIIPALVSLGIGILAGYFGLS